MSAKQSRPTSDPRLVLIVDDEPDIVETLAIMVTELGYTPLLATNGIQALVLARERWPALVLTDLMMPQMTGAELIVALREEAAISHRVPPLVVVLTAGGKRAMEGISADVILSKPFEFDDLERLLHDMLRSSRT